MATTTAAVTLTSDLLSDALSVSTTTTCMKAGTTADGLDQMDTGYIEIPTGDVYDILSLQTSDTQIDKANKVYICNESTDETYYVSVTVKAEVIGRLYAGDWMFIPADFHDAAADIAITSNGGTNKIEYALIHEGTALTTT